MTSFFLHVALTFIGLFLLHVVLTSAIDVREMSIDEYINFVNPPAVHKFQNKYGDDILCVKFSDQISVKYAHNNITRGLKKSPKLKSSTLNISNFDSGGVNSLKLEARSDCPEDTVEVREIKREDVERAGSVRQFLERGGGRKNFIPNVDDIDGAAREVRGKLESIEVGWTVYPDKYGDSEPRFFVFWTSNNYDNGCYDLDCEGYVAIEGALTPGSPIGRGSQFGGIQSEVQITIEQQERARVGEVWALLYENELIGYWPLALFDGLVHGAAHFDCGGEVTYTPRPQGTRMTRTEMGSGDFAWKGYRSAAYIRSMKMYDSVGHEIHCQPSSYVTRPECYDFAYPDQNRAFMGKHIFFGGPGGSDQNRHRCVA